MKQAYIQVNDSMRCFTVEKAQIYQEDHVIGLEFMFDFSSLEEEPTKDYPGLINMGMTCYMNSYLQTMFHLKLFVKEIFKVGQLHSDEDCGGRRRPNKRAKMFILRHADESRQRRHPESDCRMT
jgi:uncharacterized UBP type Zn finger protein